MIGRSRVFYTRYVFRMYYNVPVRFRSNTAKLDEQANEQTNNTHEQTILTNKRGTDGFPGLFAQASLNKLRTGGARVFTLQYHLDGEGWETTKTRDEPSIRLYPAIQQL